MAYETVMSMLENSGLPFTLHHHPRVCTIDDAERLVPHLTHNLLKTVVFKIKDSHWILAAVNGHDRIDYKQLARAFGVNRKLIRTVSPDAVEDQLGFEIGGTGPFPVLDSVKIIMDQSLEDLCPIFCGSGKNTETIEMDIADLICLVSPIITKITKD